MIEDTAASAFGYGVHTQKDSRQEIRRNIREAVECYFDESMPRPKVIHLHFLREEEVIEPKSPKKQADQLLKDGRVHCALPADYSEGKKLEEMVFAKLKEIAARESLLRKLK